MTIKPKDLNKIIKKVEEDKLVTDKVVEIVDYICKLVEDKVKKDEYLRCSLDENEIRVDFDIYHEIEAYGYGVLSDNVKGLRIQFERLGYRLKFCPPRSSMEAPDNQMCVYWDYKEGEDEE